MAPTTLTAAPGVILRLTVGTLENLQSASDEASISSFWTVFTKCKDNLENGRRLENLSWRLWYRSTHIQQKDARIKGITASRSSSNSSSASEHASSQSSDATMPIDPTDSPRTSTAPQTDSTAANRASFFIASSHTSEESVEENHRRPTNRVVLQIPVNISPDDIDEDLDASDFDDEDDEFDDDDDEDEYEDDDEDYDDNENYDDDQTMDQREDDLSLLFRKQDLPDPASSRPPSPPGQSSSASSPVLKDSPSRKSLLSEAIAGGGLQRSVSLFGDRLLNATSSRCPSTSNCPRATLAPLPGSAPSALNTAPLSAQPSASSIQVESQELLAVDAPVQAPSDTATVLSESLRRNLLFDRLMPFNVLHLKNHPTGATSGVPGPSQMGRGADPLADMDGWW